MADLLVHVFEEELRILEVRINELSVELFGEPEPDLKK